MQMERMRGSCTAAGYRYLNGLVGRYCAHRQGLLASRQWPLLTRIHAPFRKQLLRSTRTAHHLKQHRQTRRNERRAVHRELEWVEREVNREVDVHVGSPLLRETRRARVLERTEGGLR